jgi:hypothetical protein
MRFRPVSGVLTLTPRAFQLMWLADRVVHFRAAIGHAVDHVFSGDSHDEFRACGSGVNVRSQDTGGVIVDRCHRGTDRAADATLADEGKSVFETDAIHRDEVDPIFHGAAIDGKFRHVRAAGRPVGGQQNDVRSLQREYPRCLRKRAVVADQHSDPYSCGFERLRMVDRPVW